jgi:ribosomal protein S18 acetylase RimI-like enzyme
MVDLVEKEGFEKKYDLVTYKFTVNQELPEFYLKISERAVKNNVDLKVLEFTSRKKVRPYIHPALRLLNRTFNHIYGFNPLSDKEMDDFANRYLYLINPRFIKIAVNRNNEVIAFIIGMSDISRGIQKSKGHLFPFGIFHILRAGKKSKLLTLMLIAIDPEYQNRGLNVQMALKMIESAKAAQKSHIDTHLELEYNTKVRGEMEKLGAVIHKKFRIYQKDL